jgi:lipopolysaccharide transport system permease protein
MRPHTVIEPPSLSLLHAVGAARRLPQFAELLRTLTAHRLSVRYKQSKLGLAWAMIHPLAMMLVFTLMFTLLGRSPAAGVPYPVFAYAALVPWVAFAGGLSTTTNSLTSHASLLTKVYFPREILPLTYVAAALVDLAVASIALVALMIWYGIPLTWTAWWALPAVMLMGTFLTGAGLLLSATQVRYRDVGIAMPMVLQIWMFGSPVIYPLQLARDVMPGWLYQLYLLNPMAGVVDTFRSAIVLHRTPDLQALASGALVAAVLLPAAYAYFKFKERTMADAI